VKITQEEGKHMKIGLIDVDSKLPNLALMKLKSYYPDAEFAYPLTYERYDKIYASSIFDYTAKAWVLEKAIRGGTGFDITSRLPEGIERCQPDYSLYPDCNFSYQRFTYGCIRQCGFCAAWQMGRFQELEPMNMNPKGKYIYLLDNNFFASKGWKQNIEWLIKQNQPVQFEGIDARIISRNDKMLSMLNRVKLKGRMHMAWDFSKQNLTKDFEEIIKIINPEKIMVYVLIGFDSIQDEDLYRVEKLRSLKLRPFVMPYSRVDKYQRRFARWANRKAIFNSTKWEDYKYNK
jgi:hypothetical protein